MSHPKLERITEETLTPEHVERVRRAILGVPRKNSLHRAILTDCASVLDGNTAARETVVRTWNAMVPPRVPQASRAEKAVTMSGQNHPTRVFPYPALRRHALCEPRTLGSSSPTVISRGLTCRSDRHAGRSEGMP